MSNTRVAIVAAACFFAGVTAGVLIGEDRGYSRGFAERRRFEDTATAKGWYREGVHDGWTLACSEKGNPLTFQDLPPYVRFEVKACETHTDPSDVGRVWRGCVLYTRDGGYQFSAFSLPRSEQVRVGSRIYSRKEDLVVLND